MTRHVIIHRLSSFKEILAMPTELSGCRLFWILAFLVIPAQMAELIQPHANSLHFIFALAVGIIFIAGTWILLPVLKRKFDGEFKIWPFKIQMVLAGVNIPFSALPVPASGWLHVYMASVGALSLINGVLSLVIGVFVIERLKLIDSGQLWLWRLFAVFNISSGFLAASIIFAIEAVVVSVLLYGVTGMILSREASVGKLSPAPQIIH